MANFFVISRMKNVAERKAVIDVLHSLGHETGFIESQQMREGADAKSLMNIMADRADGLVIVVDDDQDLGRHDPTLGNRPPMVYEVTRFLERDQNKNWRDENRVLVFGRRAHDGWSRAVKDIARILQCSTDLATPFEYYDDLAIHTFEKVCETWGRAEATDSSPLHLHIQWFGRDEPGRLGTLAGFLFTEFGLNVTHLSGMGVDHRGSITLTGTTATRPLPTVQEIRTAIEDQLQLEVQVEETQPGFRAELYFELRVLDVPGVLNALCKVLGDEVSIADIRQRPTYSEYERQAEILMWLSIPGSRSPDDVERIYLRLEARLRNLVGVRALSSRRLPQAGSSASVE